MIFLKAIYDFLQATLDNDMTAVGEQFKHPTYDFGSLHFLKPHEAQAVLYIL